MPKEIHPYWGDAKINKKEIRGVIRPWAKHYYDKAGNFVIIGTLYTPDGQYRKSHMFRTSTVVAIDEIDGTCETLNSLYRLEEKSAD